MKKYFSDKKFRFLCLLILVLSVLLNIYFLFNKSAIKYVNDENIIFFGDSITKGYDVEKFFSKHNVINQGINGNRTSALLERVNSDVYVYNPSKIFILIGINDLCGDLENEDILFNIQSLISDIKINREYAKIYVESVYPVNIDLIKKNDVSFALNLDNKRIIKLNSEIEKLCKENNVNFIDLYDYLLDKNGNLKDIYTTDGLHLNNLGYLKVTSVLKKYVEEK